MTPTEKILLIAVIVGCFVIVILMATFTFLSTPLYFRKPDIHAPRTAVELEQIKESNDEQEPKPRLDKDRSK